MHIMTKNILTGLLIVSVVLFVMGGWREMAVADDNPGDKAHDSANENRVTGNGKPSVDKSVFKLFKSNRSVIAYDVKELTRRSGAIIIGRPLSNKSRYVNEITDVHTEHLILVQMVLKGSVKNGSLLDLEMPGGGLLETDGTMVYLQASDARPVRKQTSYFIFMNKAPGKRNWTPALGIQGVFEIDADTDSIIPCDLIATDPVVKKYKNISMNEFFHEIMAAVESGIPRRKKQ